MEKLGNLSKEERANMGLAARAFVKAEFDQRVVNDLYFEEVKMLLKINGSS